MQEVRGRTKGRMQYRCYAMLYAISVYINVNWRFTFKVYLKAVQISTIYKQACQEKLLKEKKLPPCLPITWVGWRSGIIKYADDIGWRVSLVAEYIDMWILYYYAYYSCRRRECGTTICGCANGGRKDGDDQTRQSDSAGEDVVGIPANSGKCQYHSN